MKPTTAARICLGLALIASTPGFCLAQNPKVRDTRSDAWAATDALGRVLPGEGQAPPPRAGKFVAIFYFLWIDGEVSRTNGGLFDNTKLVAADPRNPAYGPVGSFHWWGEPWMGYYLNDDEFVIRKHAQMLSDAGVDAIAFDVTNGPTYDHNLETVCRVFERIRKEGGKTPQVFFLANSGSAQVVKRLHDEFYARGRHRDLWFLWKGKPLILAPTEGLSAELKAFFTVRHSWAWSDPNGWFGDGRDKWTWVDNFPQNPGWHDAPGKPEQISVSVAQHATNNIGRSYHAGKEPPPANRPTAEGLYFAEQWTRALEVDPELIFVTGWNEWIAQRFISDGTGPEFLGAMLKKGGTFFVDQYSQEFSRDIEPMRGGHGDAYYYQLVAGVRRFKGVRPAEKATAPRTIALDRGFTQWRDVGPEFLDDLGDAAHRNHFGWGMGPLRYINTTGRNDLESAKVARDATHVYFSIRSHEPMKGAPMLLIDVDGDRRTGWEGYDFAVNRLPGLVEKHSGGRTWTPVGPAPGRSAGRDFHLAVPRALLGLDASRGPLKFDFKWVDGVPESGEILDFIDKGDVAPNGRFNYRYRE